MHTSVNVPYCTQGENKGQQECVFAWTVLLRNVTRVPESQKGIMGELQQRNWGQICVPAPTWTRQNCNISVNKHLSACDQSSSLQRSVVRDCGLKVRICFFIFRFLYPATAYKSTGLICATNWPQTLKSFFQEETMWHGAVRETQGLNHCSMHTENSQIGGLLAANRLEIA